LLVEVVEVVEVVAVVTNTQILKEVAKEDRIAFMLPVEEVVVEEDSLLVMVEHPETTQEVVGGHIRMLRVEVEVIQVEVGVEEQEVELVRVGVLVLQQVLVGEEKNLLEELEVVFQVVVVLVVEEVGTGDMQLL
jgi:hypothetical protein